LGENFRPPKLETHFQFPDDSDNFARAAIRCVGVGKCRREEGGLMCPSYMATRAEKDSTRGRAHLLFEMLKGETIKDGWKSEEVKEALDLCLSCKGCKSDCPTNVDMATYKAEFLSHYYEGRLRPRHAYAFGYIEHWACLGSMLSGTVNFFTQTPGLSFFTKMIAGISPERQIPKFAIETFKKWFKNRTPTPGKGVSVLLWPDTFTNYFQPEIGRAAVEVLEHLGFRVVVPDTPLCCGRPLYDFGFLDQAKRQLQDILKLLEPSLEAGIPLIVLEPSCAAVFRDELVNLFPKNPLARKLRDQTLLLSEFLVQRQLPLPKLENQALVQPHCHQQSVLGFDAEKAILAQLGLAVTYPEAGCCGMAGSFGFEKDHVGVSTLIAERALLPAVRRAAPDTLVIADGFSCREQIRQGTDRKALHLAEVLKLAFAR
jgi:Fe-S oxidoreductase